MAYVGIDGKARKITNMYVGVDGVARKIIKGYVGVDGIARLIYIASSTPGGGDEPGYSGDPANFPIMAEKNTWYKSSANRTTITEIEFLDTYTPGSYDETWYADVNNTGAITCYRIGSKLIIAGNGSGGINANANSMYMFFGKLDNSYENLTAIRNLSLLNTSNTKNMYGMFYCCSSLTYLNVSNFNTSNVSNMGGMFWNCKSLVLLDLSNFDTSNNYYMEHLFTNCQAMVSVDMSSFITSKVVNMTGMFAGCSNLNKIDISRFDTSNVDDISQMFARCSSLTSLDLSNFDTSNIIQMIYTFQNCSNLKTIYVSRDKWVIRDDCNTNNMFSGCGTDHLTYI